MPYSSKQIQAIVKRLEAGSILLYMSQSNIVDLQVSFQ